MDETYDFEIPEEGLSYDILDEAFNPTTQSFILNGGILPGMRVLDVGSGSGIMTHFLARQVGKEGHVWSIDNSQEQLERAAQYCQKQGDKNTTFKTLSLYDLESLHENFDLIYCRFVLHHVHKPRQAIDLFYHLLNKNGICIAEEGIISAAFAYPPSMAWHYTREKMCSPDEEKEGIDRDGDFGMKVNYWMKKSGFIIKNTQLVQPILSTYDQKKKLIEGHDVYKKTFLESKSEAEWQKTREELIRLAKDDFSIIGFYQSCQVAGIKK